MVRTRTLPACDWRLGHDPALVRYGVELVEQFLAASREASSAPLRREFRCATLANFNPRGVHFDGFVVRLFEHADAIAPAATGYALGMRIADLPVELSRAIDGPARQRAIVASIYQACEDYFVRAVERFGDRYRHDLLTPCWDTFRHEIGPLLLRFRPPSSAEQCEWVALARSLPLTDPDPITFPIVQNRLVPTAAIPIGARTLETIAIGTTVPFETTSEALHAYLHRQGMHRIAITPIR